MTSVNARDLSVTAAVTGTVTTASRHDAYGASARALEAAKALLDQGDLFGDVTRTELLQLNTLLKQQGTYANQLIMGLGDRELTTWANELDGVLGLGGLNRQERQALFDTATAALEFNQLQRFYQAFAQAGFGDELLASIAKDDSHRQMAVNLARQTTEPSGELSDSLQQLAQLENAQANAQMAAGAYRDQALLAPLTGLPPGTIRLDPTAMPDVLNHITAADLDDNQHSGFFAAIYQHGSGDQTAYTVAFRGSENIADPHHRRTDWLGTNGGSILRITSQHQRADALVAKVIDAVGLERVSVTGHSLGGGLAYYSGLKHQVTIAGFNSKGLAHHEMRAIGSDNVSAADQLAHNYYVRYEGLTSLNALVNGVGISSHNPYVMQHVPGPHTQLNAVRPDGTLSNIVTESVVEAIQRISPFHSAQGHNVADPIDRHGIDYITRGLADAVYQAEVSVLESLLQTP